MKQCFLKNIAFVVSAAISIHANALHGEYFWNTDPGIDRATSITLSDNNGDSFFSADIPAESIPDGLNLFGIRARYSSCWSRTVTALVWKPSSAGECTSEYFFDTDPGVGMATPLNTSSGVNNVVIPTEGLTPGRHLLGIRSKGASGWSPTQLSRISIADGQRPQIDAVEYFWLSDQGSSEHVPIDVEPGKKIDINDLDISFPEHDSNDYSLCFMAQSDDQWHMVYSTSFKNIAMTDINLEPSAIELNVGDMAVVAATAIPANALFTDINWESGDEALATVDANGRIRGISPGETTVTASSKRNPEIKSTCLVSIAGNTSDIITPSDETSEVAALTGGIKISCSIDKTVNVYNSSGICIASFIGGNGIFVHASPGLYIVTIGSENYKVAVK